MLGFTTVLPPAERAVAGAIAAASGETAAPAGAADPGAGLDTEFFRALLALLGGPEAGAGEEAGVGSAPADPEAGAQTLPLSGNSLPEAPLPETDVLAGISTAGAGSAATPDRSADAAGLVGALPPGPGIAAGGALDEAARPPAAGASALDEALRPAIDGQRAAVARYAGDGHPAAANPAVVAREPVVSAPLDPAADRAFEVRADLPAAELLKPLVRAVEPAAGGTVQPGMALGATPEPGTPAPERGRVSLPIHAPLDQPEWGDEVGQRIRWLTAQNIQIAELRINPPQLGPIEVRVTVNHDQTSLLFTAHHALVREALEESVPRLRELMSGSGLNLADVDVREHSSSGRQGHAAQGGDGHDAGPDRGAQQPTATPEIIDQLLPRGARGIVDLYA